MTFKVPSFQSVTQGLEEGIQLSRSLAHFYSFSIRLQTDVNKVALLLHICPKAKFTHCN